MKMLTKKISLTGYLLMLIIILTGCSSLSQTPFTPEPENFLESFETENTYFLAGFFGKLNIDNPEKINLDNTWIIAVVTFPETTYTIVKYEKFNPDLTYNMQIYQRGKEFKDYEINLFVYDSQILPEYNISFREYNAVNSNCPLRIQHKDFSFQTSP